MSDKQEVQTDRYLLIEKALKKITKAEMVKLIVKLSKRNNQFTRDLEAEVDVQQPFELIFTDVENAICRATEFDVRNVDHHFDYDSDAYDDIKKGFESLIALGHLESLKSLAIRLMKKGSYQVECSDEGMMTNNIQDGLEPVIRAVENEGGAAAGDWAFEMLLADRVGFI